MNVELRHFRALAAIGDEGTITGAAAALRISQPALSRTLSQLERGLGTQLVERTTRNLHLTEAGRRLWEHAHRILAHVDDALAEVSAGPRPLRIGFAWAALGHHTVPLLREWRRDHPDIPLQAQRLDDPEAALRCGDIDLAFLRTPTDDDEFYSLPLYQERRLVALSEDDPLATRPSLELADIADRTIAMCASAGTTSTELWSADRRPSTTIEVANVDEWLTVIATGDAVGVTAEATGHSHPHPGVRYLPIADAPPITVCLVWPPYPVHSAAATFREHARRTVET
ncbi:LysR family transcriptional regulator [Nocardiopsis gilva YIM 90087]|uniref:LysR family transcriptional regulator n=1 Tax=Nocardiopsis gilva YIM 90087 TaxID=1235441 RepID=A0A223S1V7_9ACTN|nr:LysR family transcriptional regulator [Nocardiopsis gilva]ASU82120.1 LysR family transcriptional regulator [Nocardiopsis gilva YIM 90087]